jgi:hypothetical protein
MMYSAEADYGALTDVVTTAGSIMAAAGAISLAWRGRTRWEPSEQDLPKGGQKVGALIAAVLIVVAWASFRDASSTSNLNRLTIISAAVALFALLIYGGIVGGLTYIKRVSTAPDQVNDLRVLGGFWLTAYARKVKRERGWPVQKVYAGTAYDEDHVWPRVSRQLSKATCVLGYVVLTVSGTLALALAAIRLGIAVSSST